jgi:hypothetical protein
MTTQLQAGSTTVVLSDDLFWADENNWNQVEQTATRTITGALIVQSAQRVGGRPITLQPPDDSSAWMSRDTVDQLRNLAAVAGREMTLTLRGSTYDVIFRHHDGVAVEAKPVVFFRDEVPGDFYLCTLRLMEL